MYKWQLGGCPRCRGDLYLDNRDDRRYAEQICLQCGYRKSLLNTQPLQMSDRHGKVKQDGRRYG